ncbi:Uncharacterised protein [Mycoplasmopsis californica]|nr:Uncharacterised protein [Mycoplasmopsis californica]
MKLNYLRKNASTTNMHIANELLKLVKNQAKINKTKELAAQLNVSTAAISKFVRKCEFNNFNEFCFVHNQSILNDDDKTIYSELIKKSAELIGKSHKIMFIGVSGSYINNLDFAHKLQRLNKCVLTPESKYDQIGLSRLLTNEDLLIVNSLSLQHTWILDVIANTKAKVILSSSFVPEHMGIKDKIDVFNLVENIKDFKGGLRLYTTDSLLKVASFYIKIFEYLIKDESNLHYLQLSSYN